MLSGTEMPSSKFTDMLAGNFIEHCVTTSMIEKASAKDTRVLLSSTKDAYLLGGLGTVNPPGKVSKSEFSKITLPTF